MRRSCKRRSIESMPSTIITGRSRLSRPRSADPSAERKRPNHMSKRTKWSLAGVFGIAIVAVIAHTAMRSGRKAGNVRIEPVQRRDLVSSVTASGQVQPQLKVDLSSDITGKIVRLSVKEGQIVAKGQFLLQIDPKQAEGAVQGQDASLASSKAGMAQAEANLLQAQKSYERTAAIKKTNPTLISDKQLEQLRTAVDVNKALYEAARHQVEQANALLSDARSSLGK